MKNAKKLIILGCTLVLTIGICKGWGQKPKHITLAANKTTTGSTKIKGNKIVIGHRGASGYLPEHTLESYTLAYGQGADYIECDVCLSKDGVPVIMHDTMLDTTTDVAQRYPNRKRVDGHYYVIDFTLSEIKTLRVHERTKIDSKEPVYPGRFPLNSSHFEIPTLEEMIELVQGLNKSTGNDKGIYPELKEPKFHTDNGQDIGSVVLKVLRKYGYDTPESKIYLQCFDPTYLRKVRTEMGAKMKMVQLIGEEADCPGANYKTMMSNEGLAKVAEYANGIGPWYQQIIDENGKKNRAPVINPNLVKDAHKHNLVVHPYTFRKDEIPKYVTSVDQLIQKFYFEVGVDGVFTDFSDIAVKVLANNSKK
ncbi:MAG: glycerophosphodiester phosphodiesterase [Clostridium sp.]|uniref:glycerophosphodiester phosphodiesterase n=1 Tax=Clostridium sp. TaxID=1506 RepID=UPI003D6DA5FC